MTDNTENGFEKFFAKYKIIILIVLIFIMAFAIRGHLLKYDYMFEFDTYWHLRMTGYTLQGDLPENDPLGFYAQGGSNLEKRPPLVWYLTSFIYIIFTLGAPFKKELLMQFARVLPAIFGALISIAMYFLGKEIYNRKAGIIMAVVAATIPAFVYRTMAGFYEEDSLGFLWLIIGFIFLVKAIKNIDSTKHYIKYAAISGLFFGIMAFTWDMFLLIPLILVSFFVCNLIYMAYKNTSNKQMASFFKIFVISFVIFIALASIAQPIWLKRTSDFVVNYIPITKDNIDRIHNRNVPETNVLTVSVGEENVGKKFFLYKYSFLIWIPFLAIVLMPLYLIFSKRKDYFTLILFFWIIITLLMAWSKLKFTFALGLPTAAGAGFLFYIFDEWIKNKSINYKRFFALFIGLVLLTSIAAGTHEVYTKVPHIVEKTDWRESIFWISENSVENEKIFNWWDYGHWLAYFTERKVSSDNTNSYMEANSDFGLFILSEDFNFTKEVMIKYDSDYFIADNTYFNRYTSFGSYGYLTTNYQDPRISRYISFIIDCQKGLLENNSVAYKCGENIFSEEDINMVPTEWTDKPLDVINGIPFYIYRLEDNSKMIFLNKAANNSTFAKIWLNEENHSLLFSTVYENGDVRIYKINKDFLNE
jgi:asparagine N-glycosylation enzyme membrane subunit Stt3